MVGGVEVAEVEATLPGRVEVARVSDVNVHQLVFEVQDLERGKFRV